jgi:hypothetical protein
VRLSEAFNWPREWGDVFQRRLTDVLRALTQRVNNMLATPLRIGGATDYVQIENDGTIKFVGGATVWQDIDFPLIARTAVANQPTPTTLKGNVTAPAWAVNDYLICEGQEMVHAWREGSEVQWHVHVVTNGLDASDRYIRFEVEWVWANPSGVLSATVTTTSADLKIPANTTDRTHFIFELAKVTFAGTIGGHVWARLKRVAAVGTAPSASPFCSMLQMHIECDTVGSRSITSKA